MAFHDEVFPEDISYGSTGGPGFNTTVIELDSGAEMRFARWSTPRRKYDVAYGVKSLAQLSTLIDFYVTRQGALNSFKYKDFFDFTSASDHRSAHSMTDVILGTGDGSVTQFQLKTKYTSNTNTQYRTVTKPKTGTVLVSVNGVSTTAFSTNTTTGVLTLTSPPTAGHIVRAGFEYYVQVRFEESVDEVLELTYEDFASGGLGSVPLIEVIEENSHPETFDYGGSETIVKGQDFELEVANGRFQVLITTASSLTCTLPPAGDLELGGPHFYLKNSGANSITIADGSTTVLTLAAGDTIVLLVQSVASAQAYVGVVL